MAPTLAEPPRPRTPPHEPKYGVHMPYGAIENIVRRGFPRSMLTSIHKLPADKSYNNRIYLLDVRRPHEASGQDELQLVLKVNGRPFGENKIRNEVASLRMLEAYCPHIPAPRVFAWSCEGLDTTFVWEEEEDDEVNSQAPVTTNPYGQHYELFDHGGWILMSRLPGESMSSFDLDEATMAHLGRQLADMATSWRRGIPRQKYCGNTRVLQILDHDIEAHIRLRGVTGSEGTEIEIRGILMDDIKATVTPIASLFAYYELRLERKVGELETSPKYARNRSLVPLMWDFIDGRLPKLGLDDAIELISPGERKFVFTHYDLSPRNVLISGRPPRITGIVDFEFSGFFSPVEEFLNDLVGNSGDWPKAAYDAYLQRLEQNGIATPANTIDKVFWERILCLEKLVESIAPWWLPGNCGGAELEAELQRVEQVAREMVEKLS